MLVLWRDCGPDMRAPIPPLQQMERPAEDTLEDGGSLQRLTGRNSTSGTPGAGPSAATGEADQQKGAESPHPGHRNRDPLGPGTLQHPRK